MPIHVAVRAFCYDRRNCRICDNHTMIDARDFHGILYLYATYRWCDTFMTLIVNGIATGLYAPLDFILFVVILIVNCIIIPLQIAFDIPTLFEYTISRWMHWLDECLSPHKVTVLSSDDGELSDDGESSDEEKCPHEN